MTASRARSINKPYSLNDLFYSSCFHLNAATSMMIAGQVVLMLCNVKSLVKATQCPFPILKMIAS